MDVVEALRAANKEFVRRLRVVSAEDWSRLTPCDAWDVRALVNHVIGGNRRYKMLLRGASAAEVDATRSADHLGVDAVGSFLETASQLLGVFGEEGSMSRVGHHPAGDRTGAELADMRVLDITVHAWDLAKALDADEQLDADLVEYALTCTGFIDTLRPKGYFAAPAGELPSDSSPLRHLLHLAGRR
ncbi:MAG: TIGR03086 family protein [Actinobacteria bacterium]|nr:TIGR03086 family protein [Actinomycetota bacterium]